MAALTRGDFRNETGGAGESIVTNSALAFALGLWIASVSSAQTPDFRKLDFSEAKPDLSKYATYHWSKDQVAVVNLANHIRLVTAIQKQMKELGYRVDTVKPDLRIQYKAERHQAVQSRSTQKPSPWDPTDLKVQVELSREEQVTLEILLLDEETGFLVWQAKGTYPLGTPDKAEKLIQSAVEGLFAEFPEKDEGR
jgi:hypothetical protein